MRITTRLKVISAAATAGLVVLSSLLIWTFIGFKSAEHDKALADRIMVNFFDRASFRDQYFLYREDRSRKQWDDNKEESDRLLIQARAQFRNVKDQQTLARLHQHIEDTATLFHRIVDNTRAMQTTSGGKRRIYAELDQRLASQLLLKATSVREASTTLYETSSHRVDRAYQRLIIVAGAFAVLVALLTILASISLGRLIRRRLIPLHHGAKIIASGDLAHRIEFDTQDEFAELALSINSMTAKLETFTHKLETEITERQRAESALQKSNELLQSIVQNVPAGIFWKDRDSRYLGCNTQFAQEGGYSGAEQIIGKTDLDLAWAAQAEAYRADDKATMESGVPKLDYEEPHTIDNGKTLWVRTSKVPLRDENNRVIGVLGIYQDITERHAAEEQIKHSAHFDALTELPNRTLFSDRLQQALATARREQTQLALMFVDLDRFKLINDTLGHHVGDLLLKEVAQRMQGCVRESDTVARIGGDEFVVLLPAIETEHDARVVAEKIREAISQPFKLGDHRLETSLSVGIAVYPQHGKDETQLVKNADSAMYLAKESGRNNVLVYQAPRGAEQ